MESSLRPREIQARIRAGETLAEVAEAAGVPPERIEPFAAPVLAEREHLVIVALAAPVRRHQESGSPTHLRTVVEKRLLEHGVDIDDVEWDAWRREDGRWVIQGRFSADGADRDAHFLYDTQGRFSVADDADARWLVPDAGPRPPRVEPDPDSEPTVELATTHEDTVQRSDEPEDVTDYAPAELAEVNGVYDIVTPRSDMDVLYDMISGIDEDSVRIYTGLTSVVDVTPVVPRVEVEVTVTEVVSDSGDRPESATPDTGGVDATEPEPVRTSTEPTATERPADEGVASPAPGSGPRSHDEPEQLSLLDDTAPPAPAKRRRKRASVPSWDEIMFGSPHQEKAPHHPES